MHSGLILLRWHQLVGLKGRTWWDCSYGCVLGNVLCQWCWVHLSPVWRFSLVAPDIFRTSVSSPFHTELLINTCLVKPSGICGVKWMVHLVALAHTFYWWFYQVCCLQSFHFHSYWCSKIGKFRVPEEVRGWLAIRMQKSHQMWWSVLGVKLLPPFFLTSIIKQVIQYCKSVFVISGSSCIVAVMCCRW